ncbi:MAG: NAD(P)/FAD-dependent oxidoreductase, partial [bacterium]
MPGASVAVIGAGPAGLAAAIAAATAGSGVAVFEQQPAACRRLLATGGGHCNFTNVLDPAAAAKRFGPKERFVFPALKAVDSKRLRGFFADIGVPSCSLDGFHVFPESNSAAKVRDALMLACEKLDVKFRYGARATGLTIDSGRVTGVLINGVPEKAAWVILSSGAASRPELGGGQSGFELAKAAGHTIVSPCPALVPLVVQEKWPGSLAGITI